MSVKLPLPIVEIRGDYEFGCINLTERFKASTCVLRSMSRGEIHAWCSPSCTQNHKIRVSLGDDKIAILQEAADRWVQEVRGELAAVRPAQRLPPPQVTPKIAPASPPAAHDYADAVRQAHARQVTPKTVNPAAPVRPECSQCGKPMRGPKAKPGGVCTACRGMAITAKRCACGKLLRSHSPGYAEGNCSACFRRAASPATTPVEPEKEQEMEDRESPAQMSPGPTAEASSKGRPRPAGAQAPDAGNFAEPLPDPATRAVPSARSSSLSPAGWLTHIFPLRRGEFIHVALPQDFTPAEAERFGRWASALALEPK